MAIEVREEKRLKRIMTYGIPVLEAAVSPNKTTRVYALYESRGASTNYQPALFFFFVGFDGVMPAIYRPISNKSRAQRAEYLAFWKKQGGYTILNQEFFGKYFDFIF